LAPPLPSLTLALAHPPLARLSPTLADPPTLATPFSLFHYTRSHPHRRRSPPIISAFMLASKIICDDTYSNKSWYIVGQGMFAL
ncbi:hypothetical protein BJY52DRAFT_1109202, partial [Lactarius psammicola]